MKTPFFLKTSIFSWSCGSAPKKWTLQGWSERCTCFVSCGPCFNKLCATAACSIMIHRIKYQWWKILISPRRWSGMEFSPLIAKCLNTRNNRHYLLLGRHAQINKITPLGCSLKGKNAEEAELMQFEKNMPTEETMLGLPKKYHQVINQWVAGMFGSQRS